MRSRMSFVSFVSDLSLSGLSQVGDGAVERRVHRCWRNQDVIFFFFFLFPLLLVLSGAFLHYRCLMGAGRTVPLVRAYCKSRLREGPNLIRVTGTKWPTDLHVEPTHTSQRTPPLKPGILDFFVLM